MVGYKWFESLMEQANKLQKQVDGILADIRLY